MSEWSVGQEVIVVTLRRTLSEQPGWITKVGRKYMTVELEYNGRRRDAGQFRLDNGYEKTDYSASRRIVTPEIRREELRISTARANLLELGYRFISAVGHADVKLTADRWEQLVALVKGWA